jgi:HAD superfamily hydrolase (TIGR01490 family)
MSQIIAIFDLEGTLCQGGPLVWHEIIRRGMRQPGGIFRVTAHILHQVATSNLNKVKLLGEYTKRRQAIIGMASLFRGMSLAELDEFAAQLTPKVMEVMRPDTVKILANHQKQEHLVLLCSGLFIPVLGAIASQLKVSAVIGTGLEVENSRYTGRISTDPCFEKHRVAMIHQYLLNHHIQPDLVHSYAYGDSKWDMPVLEMVGHPVAVYPDKELRDHAWNHGWKIII